MTQPSLAHPRQLPAFLAMVRYTTLAALRNPATLAFSFIFPLVFISVFGLLGNSSTSVKIGVDHATTSSPLTQALEHISIVKLQRDDPEALARQLTQGKIDAIVRIEPISSSTQGSSQGAASTSGPRYHVTVVTANGNPAGAAAATSLVRGVVDQANLQLAHVSQPAIHLTTATTDGREARYIDFALPGQIGFSLLSTAIFGTVFGFIALKKELVLKRMFATPVKPLTILTGQGASRLLFALLQALLILGVGVLVFHFYLPHGWETFGEMLLLSVIGLIAFLGFGYFLAGISNDENAAGPLINLVTLPQFLLSGVFFSTDNFPAWVQPVANNLPLSYFNIAMRKITTEGAHLTDAWMYVAGLVVWGAVMYALASRTFKWS